MNQILKAALAVMLVTFLACKGNQNSSPNGSSDTTTSARDTVKQATIYTCPMHPEVISDKPGTCPTCGMTLEPKS